MGLTGLAGLCGASSLGERSTAELKYSIDQSSSRKREAIPPEGCHVLLFRILPVPWFPDAWTWRWSGARIGQAAVVLKGIRAGSREVLNIGADRGTKVFRDLDGRVASNDVAANHVAALRDGSDENSIQVSTDLVLLDDVVFACAHESDAEVVTVGRSLRKLRGS